MAIIRGTEGNDTLNGTDGDDQIFGLAGDDYIDSAQGNDSVFGGDGNDIIGTSVGNKMLFGGNGNDVLYGGFDSSILYGDDGNDVLSSGKGNSTLYGGNGDDRLSGSDSDSNTNTLFGGNGNDTLESGSSSETLNGGAGNDFLTDYAPFFGEKIGEIDIFTGGAGKDTFGINPAYDDLNSATAGTSDYVLIKDFNRSDDFIQLTGSLSNYILAGSPAGSPQGTAIYFDKLDGQTDELIAIVENSSGLNLNSSYFTTSVDDELYFSDSANRFDAGEGNDTVSGNGGDDILIGGNGDDYLWGKNGNDSLRGDNGNDFLIGENGNDSLIGGNGDDTLNGVVIPTNYPPAPDSKGQIDTLTGGAGVDNFLLGAASYYMGFKNTSYVFYDDENTTWAGTNDYALITDFNSSQDVIQLKGTPTNYILGSSPSGLPTGTGIFLDKPNAEPDELIGIVQGVNSSSLSLTASYFSYV